MDDEPVSERKQPRKRNVRNYKRSRPNKKEKFIIPCPITNTIGGIVLDEEISLRCPGGYQFVAQTGFCGLMFLTVSLIAIFLKAKTSMEMLGSPLTQTSRVRYQPWTSYDSKFC